MRLVQSSPSADAVSVRPRCPGATVAVASKQRSRMMTTSLDTSLHERRRAQRVNEPVYRDAYERAAREITQTDQVIRELDSLRVDLGISKAELARRIDRNASSIRRLFTARHARPELPLIAAIADALGAEVRIVAKRETAKDASKADTRHKRTSVAA